MTSGLPTSPRGFRVPRCEGCALSLELCVCALWSPLASDIDISVVMPRSEARSASNSARLVALWLPQSKRFVRGEGGLSTPAELTARSESALLFPAARGVEMLPQVPVRHLIVPDGTWSQARRIERRWFAPHSLPRVALGPDWPSVYSLRRGRVGLCTFEAIAISIGLLGSPALGKALLERFCEWAARAQALKAGGTSIVPLAARQSDGAHPASARL